MPRITPNRTIEQHAPLLKVTNQLKPGKHLFRLSVVNDDGIESRPAELTVTIDRANPFDRVNPRGR